MTRACDFVPSATGAKRRSSGTDVERLQNYLRRFGYFDAGVHTEFGMTAEGAVAPPEHIGEFDERTEEALQKFQAFIGLEQTGTVDAATLDALRQPRCGLPDLGLPGGSRDDARFVAQGNRWDHLDLRYGFVNYTPDLTATDTESAVAAAFGLWSAVAPLRFAMTSAASNPEIRIRFASGEHGDGSPFDGAGGVLAHAFYPPPNGGDIAGDAHFDEAETWTTSGSDGFDLQTVAAHEFGHALGLAHSTVPGALMFPTYSGAHRYLADDDIAGIQSIYGSVDGDRGGAAEDPGKGAETDDVV